MKPIVKKGILLGRTRFKESSLIIRVLSEDGSLVSLMFKGALRRKSGIAARIKPFALLEFVYYHKRERSIQTASEVSVVEDFSENIGGYNSQVRAAKYIKKAASLLQPEQSNPEIFDIVLALLREWEKISSLPENLLWSAFLLKIMTFAGFAPTIFQCALCNGKIDERNGAAFSPSAGGLICSSCPNPNDAIPFTAEMVKSSQFLISNSFDKLFQIDISANAMNKLAISFERFWAFHIGEDKKQRKNNH